MRGALRRARRGMFKTWYPREEGIPVRQFERLRNREHDALSLCAGLLGRLSDAQERVPGMLG